VLKKKKFIIGGLIVVMAIAYLTFMGFSDSGTYYYETGQLLEQGSSIYGETVRVNGKVSPGSLVQEDAGRTLRFTIVDIVGDESLPVVYQGVVPDTFKVGNDVVIEGHLDSAGIFQAHTLMPKCPSKYVPAG